jgi:hypothetical protein
MAEGFADRQTTQEELEAAYVEAERAIHVVNIGKEQKARLAVSWCANPALDVEGAAKFVPWGAAYAARGATDAERSAQAPLLREVFGNPFLPASVEPGWLSWRGGTVVKLAEGAYEERKLPLGALSNARLEVLADALEEAGCTDPTILAHCRGPGPHVRGCWVVDLLLGKR